MFLNWFRRDYRTGGADGQVNLDMVNRYNVPHRLLPSNDPKVS